MINLLFIIVAFLAGCSPQPIKRDFYTVQEICGRDASSLIYRVRVPNDWTRKDPEAESLSDTTKPLCEFYIKENGEEIRITIHNFPVENASQRIPPGAQISRWKSQLKNPTNIYTNPQAFGGFFGFLFEGTGHMNGNEIQVMGWAMQIAPEHYSILTAAFNSPIIKPEYGQMRAEYTIKATGPKALMERHRTAIMEFARSFELIQEIPSS